MYQRQRGRQSVGITVTALDKISPAAEVVS